jgi:L-ascorbate metabolism protein UlaG (beta-lactamase superfamily)
MSVLSWKVALVTSSVPTTTINLTFLGHACALVEVIRPAHSNLRLIVDPGNLTPRLDSMAGIDGILVTHAHPDHIDPEQVRALRLAGRAPVYGDAATANLLAAADVDDISILEAGEFELDGFRIGVSVHPHEIIYPGVPVPSDFAFDLGGRIFAPGDAFAIPTFEVELLLLPLGAPWMKLSETIDYLNTVAPQIAVPIHDGGLAAPHRGLHRALVTRFAPAATSVKVLEPGEGIEL